ncbi:MAG TPA: arylsulfotransferase family protein [Candidatus Eisenbacteria bacterium]|nr:arylsulfotransferase family protein [Candidatus Eisenbacteria bacterium]
MPFRLRSLATLLVPLFLAAAAGAAPSPHSIDGFDYVSPAPGSGLQRPGVNLIVRPGGRVVPASLRSPGTIEAGGSISGPHAGTLRLSDDGRTILFRPDQPFVEGETVTCVIAPGIVTDRDGSLPGASFTFRTMGSNDDASAPAALDAEARDVVHIATPPRRRPAPAASDDPPEDFPRMATAVWGETGPGYLFLADFTFSGGHPSTLMIVRNDGSPVFTRRLAGRAFDFKTQPDGRLTYYDTSHGGYTVLNPRFEVAGDYRCGNGYTTDNHDLRLLEDGHALLLSYDAQVVDMSAIVPGGDPRAVVTGLVVQELDLEKEVVFQWRSWDHFQITDAVNRDLTAAFVDYVHGNSIDRDSDGDLLISCRHMNEITKIDRETGGIVWRMGGKNNEFAFPNDPVRFAHQHAVRRLANGNILLFDNGNFRVPFFSRVSEYAVDEVRKTATLVWQHRDTPDATSPALGYAQRLPNGNTLIGWGAFPKTVSEVTPEGRTVFDGSLPATFYSYRVYRQEWPPVVAARVALEPRVLGPSGRGGWVTAAIGSDWFDVGTIDLAGVRIAGDVAADPKWKIRETGPDGAATLRVRFDRQAILERLNPGPNRVEIEGPLSSGARFRESLDLKVAGPPARGPASARLLSIPGALPARVVVGAPHERVRLVVFDVAGRVVRAWDATVDDQGAALWDGSGPGGVRAAGGVYFLRAAGMPHGAAARIVVAR